jgi:hypothetical protein
MNIAVVSLSYYLNEIYFHVFENMYGTDQSRINVILRRFPIMQP